MTEKHRFTDFTFDRKDDIEVRWKKTKNGFIIIMKSSYSNMVLE